MTSGISPISSNDSPSYFNPYAMLQNRIDKYSSMPEFQQDEHMQSMIKQSRELLNSVYKSNGIGNTLDIQA